MLSLLEGSNPSPSAKSEPEHPPSSNRQNLRVETQVLPGVRRFGFRRSRGSADAHRRAPPTDALARELAPCARRVASVALPMCGSRTRGVARPAPARVHLGLALVDVDARGEDRASSSAIASASSSTTGPRAVFTSTAVGFISASRRASIKPPGLLGERNVQADDVGPRGAASSRSGVQPGCPVSCRCGAAPPCRSPPRDARRPGRCGRTRPCRGSRRARRRRSTCRSGLLPIARRGRRLRLPTRAARRQDQEEGEIGGRLVEHAGRVAHRDPERGGRRRRRCCRSPPRPCRRPEAARAHPPRAPRTSTGSNSRHRIPSNSGAWSTSSSWEGGARACTTSCPAADEHVEAAVGRARVTRTRAIGLQRSQSAPARKLPVAPPDRKCTFGRFLPRSGATGELRPQREGTGLAAGTGGIRADPAGGAMRAWGDWLDDTSGARLGRPPRGHREYRVEMFRLRPFPHAQRRRRRGPGAERGGARARSSRRAAQSERAKWYLFTIVRNLADRSGARRSRFAV